MIVKGYNLDCSNQEAPLHKHVSEYGLNLNQKDNINIFAAHKKPKNCLNSKNHKKSIDNK